MDMNYGRSELQERMGVMGGGGQRGKKWDICNSIINKIFFKKRKSQTLVR